MALLLANYTAQKAQFNHLLQPYTHQRILMFHGGSGSGKSTLLAHCKSNIPTNIPHVAIDLKGRNLSAEQIFYRLGHRAGWQRLTTVTQQIASWQDIPRLHSQSNWQNKLRDHLRQVFTTADPEQKRERQAILTERWFEDVQSFSFPFLLLVDTYEKAPSEWDAWFSQHFLPRVAENKVVRVLVAGTRLPEPSIEWSDCSLQMELRGVAEAKAWLPVAEALGRQASLEYLAGACAALEGNPAAICKFIESLPRNNNVFQTASPVFPLLNRKNLLLLLKHHFDANELSILCFYFNIHYKDDLPGDNKQTKLVALIELIERQNRAAEFLAQLREERPQVDW